MIEEARVIDTSKLNSALNMLMAIPPFANALRQPGWTRAEIGIVDRKSLDFVEGVCKAGCGNVHQARDGCKIVTFRDCVLQVDHNGRTKMVRDQARTRIKDQMDESEVESLFAA